MGGVFDVARCDPAGAVPDVAAVEALVGASALGGHVAAVALLYISRAHPVATAVPERGWDVAWALGIGSEGRADVAAGAMRDVAAPELALDRAGAHRGEMA